MSEGRFSRNVDVEALLSLKHNSVFISSVFCKGAGKHRSGGYGTRGKSFDWNRKLLRTPPNDWG